MPLYTYRDILPASVFVFFYPEAPKIIGVHNSHEKAQKSYSPQGTQAWLIALDRLN